jgi:hypothetical protein
MMSSVEMLKEKLRGTLSEPNRPMNPGIPDDEVGPDPCPDHDEYQPHFMPKGKSSSFSGPRERRARWIKDKVRCHNVPSSTSTSSNSNYADYGGGGRAGAGTDSGFLDQEMSIPQFHSTDETQGSRRQGQGQNNNEPLNYK